VSIRPLELAYSVALKTAHLAVTGRENEFFPQFDGLRHRHRPQNVLAIYRSQFYETELRTMAVHTAQRGSSAVDPSV
jgi:hypothetical protein